LKSDLEELVNKTLIAFQNYSRPSFLIEQNIAKHSLTTIADILIATNKTTKDVITHVCYLDLSTSESAADGKNRIINEAKSKEYTHLVIVEDDVIIHKVEAIHKYIELMKKYELGTIFFGFGGLSNQVFRKPNPRLILKVSDEERLFFNCMPCSAFQVFDVEKTMLFDPTLKYLEMKEYLSRMNEAGHLPFLGMFLDVYNSFELLSTSTEVGKSPKPKDQMELMSESAMLKQRGLKYDTIKDLRTIFEWCAQKNQLIEEFSDTSTLANS